MLFLEEKAPSVRLALAAGFLIVGEIAGFSLRGLADAWAWIGFFALTGSLAAYGWGLRRIGFAVLFTLGIVLALRTEFALKDILDANSGLYGPRQALEVSVDGGVNRGRDKRSGGWRVDFRSHLGPMRLKVVLPVSQDGNIPQVGETWRVDGWISRSQDRGSRYGRRILWVPETTRARRVEEVHRNSATSGWERIREELSRRVGVGLSWCPELASLNRAILLGRRSELSKARKQAFVDAGTIHVFAISGLHVMVVAWLLNTTLAGAGVSMRVRGLVCLPLLWAYVVLTGSRPSAVRAATMTSLCLVAQAFGRRPDSLAAWSVTAMGVYGISPERLFDLGCTLSFVVMLGIVFWCHWARHFCPWGEGGGLWRQWLGGLGVSFAAWVAGVPIAAYAFGRFTPGGLLANMVAIFCAKWMVRLGFGGLVVSFVCLPLAVLLNNAAAVVTWMMSSVSECVAALPFSSFRVNPWSLPLCALWYAMWLLAFLGVGRILPRRGCASCRWW